MSKTKKTLEQIRDLLKSEPPDTREAVRLAKNLLMHGPCRREQESLRQAGILLLERLVLPALAGAQEKQARVRRLIRQIGSAHALEPSAMEGELREMGRWMAELGEQLPEARPSFAASVAQEALLTLGGKAIQPVFATDKRPDWPTLSLRLGAVIHQEHRWRQEWQQEQEMLRELLRETTQILMGNLQLLGADTGDLPQVWNSLDDMAEQTDWVALQEALVRGVERFQERAMEVRHRLRILQEAVARSRQLIRQADWALMESQDDRLIDTFTGLPNRFGLLARLEQAKQLEKSGGFALIVILVEAYTQIVRELGRQQVHQLMGAVAGRLLVLLRPGDYLARFNDETFVLIAPGMTTLESLDLAGQWRDTLDHTCFELATARVTVRSGYGVACYEPEDQGEALLELTILAAQETLAEGGERVRAIPSRHKPPPPPPPKRRFGFR
ncbi:MAG: GGDEF domain-containing protein [Magnetococcales bacterium]|nr:GGDEF domain-containing protein [Magnetococcales bacterium]